MIEKFMETEFAGERHCRRVGKIMDAEK